MTVTVVNVSCLFCAAFTVDTLVLGGLPPMLTGYTGTQWALQQILICTVCPECHCHCNADNDQGASHLEARSCKTKLQTVQLNDVSRESQNTSKAARTLHACPQLHACHK